MKNIYGITVFEHTTKEDISSTRWRIIYSQEAIIFPHAIRDVTSWRLESDLRRSDYVTEITMTNGQIFYSDIPLEEFNALVNSQSLIKIPDGSILDVYKEIGGEDIGPSSIYLEVREPEKLPLHKVVSLRQTDMSNPDRTSREYVIITDDTPAVKGWFSTRFVHFYLIESINDVMKKINRLLENPGNPPSYGPALGP